MKPADKSSERSHPREKNLAIVYSQLKREIDKRNHKREDKDDNNSDYDWDYKN